MLDRLRKLWPLPIRTKVEKRIYRVKVAGAWILFLGAAAVATVAILIFKGCGG